MKVKLKNVKQSNLMQIAEWRMSPEITQYMYTDLELTMEQQLLWHEKIQNDLNCKYWIMEADGIKIGLFYINIDYKNQKCNRQWYIGNQAYIGKGIGHTVQLNFNDYCFGNMKMNKQYCEVLADNQRAIEVNLKLGFLLEGTIKDHIYKNGIFMDVVTMGITQSHWEKIRNNYVFEKIEFEE